MVDPQGRNLIFILSTPRAGSTLLGALLGNHGQTLCPPEPWLLLCLNAMRAQDVMAVTHYDHELAREAISQLLDDRLFQQAANAFAVTAYNALLAQANKQIFIDKTPRYYHILPFLEALFPCAFKIWIKRNPLDVIASYKAMWDHTVAELLGHIPSPYSFDTTLSFPLLSAYFASDVSTKTIICYEEFVQDPVSHLQALCQRLGIPFEENMLNYGSNRMLMQMHTNATMGDKKLLEHTQPHSRSVGLWRDLLTPDEIRDILLTLGRGVFTRLEYSDLFDEAAARVGLKADEIDENGKLDQLFQLYTSYVDDGLFKSWGFQHTLIARQCTQLRSHLSVSEADRAARLDVIHDLQQRLEASEADRAAQLDVIHDLQQRLREHEATVQRLHQDLQASEAEQATRVHVIEDLQQRLREHEVTVQRLHQDLQASEADRAARLHVIEDLQQRLREHEATVQRFQQDLQASEADRAARLHVIHETQRRLEESEADRAARLEVIHALEQTIVRFSNPKSAAKHLLMAGLRKVGLYNFAKRRHTQSIPLLAEPQSAETPSMPPSAERQELATVSIPPLAEPQSADAPSMQSFVQQQSSVVISLIHSPLVNAFIDARSKPGELPDTLLETLYHCGRALRHVLCVHSTARNIQAGYMLSRAGVAVTCFAEPEYIAALERDGLRVVTKNFGEWMANVDATPIEWDAFLFDAQADWDAIQFLKGRLLPHHKIFINGVDGQEETIRQVWGAPHRITDQLFLYYAPPRSWLDPLWQQESNANPLDGWPRPSTPLVIPSTLPSGRGWPKISIITVTLNRAQFLEDCLCSVLRQGYPNLEYIVIDGGSSDGTLQLLERYGSELTYYVSEKDGGQSEALNKGFRRASGEILAWLNSDDMYLPHTLVRAAMAFDTFGADMVVGGCSLIQGEDRTPFRTHHSYFSYFPIGKVVPLPLHQLLDVDNAWLQGHFFYQPEVFWTRSMWERAGAHVNEALFYSMDYELWLRMAYHQAKIVHIPDTLALYRVHAQQKTVGDSLPYVPELRRVSTDFHEAHPEI